MLVAKIVVGLRSISSHLLESLEHVTVKPLDVELIVSSERLNLHVIALDEDLVRGEGLVDSVVKVAQPENEIVVL